MSVRQMAAVWELELPSHLKLVLLAIADHANDEGAAFPGQERLAAKCSLAPRTVRDSLAKLEQLDLLRVVRRGKKQTNLYQLYVIGGPPPLTLQTERQPTAAGDRRPTAGTDRRPTATPQEPPVEPSVEPSASAGAMLPAERWARAWAELLGAPPTRALLKAWVPMVQEFIGAGGQPTVDLLEAARERGIETPAGWSFVMGKQTGSTGAGRANGHPAGYPAWVVPAIVNACSNPEAQVDRRWAAEFDYGPHSKPPAWKLPIIQTKQQALSLRREGHTVDEKRVRALLRAELGRESK